MRRMSVVLVATTIVLGLFAGPAIAGKVSIDPDPVQVGETLKITVKRCKSGEDWDAFAVVTIEDADGERVYRDDKDTNRKGKARFKVDITKKKFPPGTYTVKVKCKHDFDEGPTGTWYEVTKTFKVKKS